jgi:hypothetical protein
VCYHPNIKKLPKKIGFQNLFFWEIWDFQKIKNVLVNNQNPLNETSFNKKGRVVNTKQNDPHSTRTKNLV